MRAQGANEMEFVSVDEYEREIRDFNDVIVKPANSFST